MLFRSIILAVNRDGSTNFANKSCSIDEIGKSLMWIDVEYNVGLIVGSLPTLRKLGVFRRAFGSSQSYAQSGGQSSTEPRSQGAHSLQKLNRNSRSIGKGGIGLGTLVLEETESRERIIGVAESSR